ncbi:Folic acid synthesis protein [Wickerhamomyces ciferrii]|uniref:Folic acid synthesis protein fol1 n=1 Tax=Wickerhamomyces ciferrii (strain ATCC 14091 / BCRC 22168 / CBS 111 / JCM 3599 / NBRC 0793 / NRRL Y-1031 F-60-10) TaxID=1206466 RepID=K0KJ50_WICCF|nr:Folic acid synthesis protein [Wickerhamomyces ciferrii]CCH42162.1 Folic acid synthesis protein [Wickerhamomyces ciferrii]
MSPDIVLINKLQVQAITGKDYWDRPFPQPINISVRLRTDFNKASESDDLKYSLNYAVISRNITEHFENNKYKNFKSLENIANSVSNVILDESKGGGDNVEIKVSGEKTEIRAEDIEITINRFKQDGQVHKIEGTVDSIKISSLKLLTLIGVFTFERFKKQFVTIDLDIKYDTANPVDYYKIIEDIVTYVENANFKTVEALIDSVAQLVIQNNALEVTAKVEKPNAITFSQGVGVEVTRSAEFFANSPRIDVNNIVTIDNFKESFNLPQSSNGNKSDTHLVYIAFGSNTGNQVQNIISAIDALNSLESTQVLETSSLYESEPMYYLDQPKFVNGALKLQTKYSPQDLLTHLKRIEYDLLGRVKIIENGPRSIDLDILLYDDLVLNEPDLIIPHMRMIERTFVLQPLCELISPIDIHPVTAEPYLNHLKQLYKSSIDHSLQKSNQLTTIVPLYNKFNTTNNSTRNLGFDLLGNSHKTRIMGILNTTPDSFSDGGLNASVEIAIKNALEMVHAGVDIIDIGGVSTRPGSIAPSEKEEWERVVPIIQAIRSHNDELLKNVVISIDTYRSHIALESIKAGADLINDISGGLYDDKMFDVIAETGVPYILNHTRGTPDTMSKLNQYEENLNDNLLEFTNPGYEISEVDETLLKAISRELVEQYQKAISHGVKRWQIITDPGIGFAKNLKQNLAIIRGTPLIKTYSNYNQETKEYGSLNGLPILLGPSRKKFIGTLTNEKNPSDRVLSTGAVIMSCIGYKSDIVRVHDVEEIKKVVAIGDALYKDLV